MRHGRLLVGLALIAAFAAGCGGGGQAEGGQAGTPSKSSRPKPKRAAFKMPPTATDGVSVTVEGYEDPADLGIVMAEQRGFFEDAGIRVWVGAPVRPSRPVYYVSSRVDDVGVAQLPQVAIAKEQGAPIVAIGSLVSQPTTAMIWLKGSKVHTLADLKGKTIAIPGVAYQKRFLASLLARAGLTLEDVHLKQVGYELVRDLLRGQADAIFGGSWNLEGAELEERGAKPVITRMQSFGAPSYEELVVIVRKDLAAEYPSFMQAFMSAIVRGADAAVRNPKAALKAMEEADETSVEIGPRVTEAQVEATLPLLSRTARIDPGKASALVGWMNEQGLIRKKLAVSELLTNDYLATRP
ncbi:MAG TPA: ABC transporter substrate-binding protein [Solirubrobacterales bacterium]|nr:ABC transporter substrate-binding protein [Solirubrobacterales bacterium]